MSHELKTGLTGWQDAIEELTTQPREQADERAVILEDDILDASHGPTRLLLLAEYWKREAQQARAALTRQAAPEAPATWTQEQIDQISRGAEVTLAKMGTPRQLGDEATTASADKGEKA